MGERAISLPGCNGGLVATPWDKAAINIGEASNPGPSHFDDPEADMGSEVEGGRTEEPAYMMSDTEPTEQMPARAEPQVCSSSEPAEFIEKKK